jgi:hypothetical protein
MGSCYRSSKGSGFGGRGGMGERSDDVDVS